MTQQIHSFFGGILSLALLSVNCMGTELGDKENIDPNYPPTQMLVMTKEMLGPVVALNNNELLFLGHKVSSPKNFMPMNLEEYLEDSFKSIYSRLYNRMAQDAQKIGAKKVLDHPGSVLWHSDEYQVRFLVTADLCPYALFSTKELQKISRNELEKKVVSNFVGDLSDTIKTLGIEVPSFLTIKQYLSESSIKSIEKTRSLKNLLKIYYDNKDVFEQIIETQQYALLKQKKVFHEVIKPEYQGNLKVIIALYQAILGWEELHNSLKLTCVLGVGEANRLYGKSLYESFLEPYLGILLTEESFEAVTTFFKDDFEDPSCKEKRFYVVKFKAKEWPKSLAIAVSGYEASTPKQDKPEEGGKCAVM